jgi:hypothetical protein
MDARQREYDRFGPWAFEISAEDPPPPLFLPYLTRSDPALLSIKLPRRIDRQEARPGMDLYDHVICLYEDDMVVLQRVGQGVRSETCRYRDVQYLRVARSLLRGDLHLGLPGRTFDIRYNTVSDDLLLRVVDVIRQRYGGERGEAPLATEPEVAAAGLSFYFNGLLASERQQPTGMRLIAAQPTIPVRSRGMSAARNFLLGVAGKRLLESVHFADGRELKIVSRGRAYAYRWGAVYDVDTCYIPLVNVVSIAWHADAKNAATDLALRTSGGASVHVFSCDNPSLESYGRFLSALPNVVHQTNGASSLAGAA